MYVLFLNLQIILEIFFHLSKKFLSSRLKLGTNDSLSRIDLSATAFPHLVYYHTLSAQFVKKTLNLKKDPTETK